MCHDTWVRTKCKDCGIKFPPFLDKHIKPVPCDTASRNGTDPYECKEPSDPVFVDESSSRCLECKANLRQERRQKEKSESTLVPR